jgi:aconitate hydratase
VGLNVTQKIISAHLAGGKLDAAAAIAAGTEIAIRIDQTLTQDATGTMAYLQFETMSLDRVRTELSVSYVDHNTLQEDWKNMDDHRYLQSAAARYGIYFSRPGNGICHQAHLERFGLPGKTLLGSDSHTPTGGGLGMLAIGAGGLDVAVAMGGGAFNLVMPQVVGVKLTGALRGAVSAKDVILEVLRRETVKGGVGKVYEYFGPGVASLSVAQRATITNMGAELGATSSVFPSDERTRDYLSDRGRAAGWIPLAADPDAVYDKVIEIDLSALTALAAKPHSPDNVSPVSELAGIEVDQVVIGSCTNSSIDDLAAVAEIVRGKRVHPRVSAGIAPGSRATLLAAEKAGLLGEFIRAGFRILESACGPCIGMGFAPKSGGVSLRTFNRNFEGRSGTADAKVYLVSPETAAAAAVAGAIVDPATVSFSRPDFRAVSAEATRLAGDDMVIPPLPLEEARKVAIERGPNIKPCPAAVPVPDTLQVPVLLVAGDNVTTDDIIPAGAKVLPLRSNIPEISKFAFSRLDAEFWKRAQAAGSGIVVGGTNYGQGSSREHAALCPMFLGVKAVLAKSFARIHKANLVNYGILPLVFENADDCAKLAQGATVSIEGIHAALDAEAAAGAPVKLAVKVAPTGQVLTALLDVDARSRRILRAGGQMAYAKAGGI